MIKDTANLNTVILILSTGFEDGTGAFPINYQNMTRLANYLTIARYFKGSAYRGRILGKTGYVSGVRSFSGVCLTDEGPYLFSILSNRSSLSRDSINRIAQAVMDEYSESD